jgi:carbon storage regulator
MLVLSRQLGEEILIGDEISVTVVEVQGNRVKLAITAPKRVPVLRAELRKKGRKQPEKKSPTRCQLAEEQLAKEEQINVHGQAG